MNEKILKGIPGRFNVFVFRYDELIKEEPEVWKTFMDGIAYKEDNIIYDAIAGIEERFDEGIDVGGNQIKIENRSIWINDGDIQWGGRFDEYSDMKRKKVLAEMIDALCKWCEKKNIECIKLNKKQLNAIRKLKQ
jgi:hypothetical protein